MAMADLIPQLDAPGLANLRANALRLVESPEPKRREQAELLLPLIDAEIALRLENKPKPKAKARVAKPKAAEVEA